MPILVIKRGSSTGFPNYTATGKACEGSNGFNDLRKGRAVTIYNQKGNTIVGTGFIKPGLVAGGSCYMLAKVNGVPRLPFYEVQFANRNKVPFSASDLIHHKAVETIG